MASAESGLRVKFMHAKIGRGPRPSPLPESAILAYFIRVNTSGNTIPRVPVQSGPPS
jgi:hypothetical protein